MADYFCMMWLNLTDAQQRIDLITTQHERSLINNDGDDNYKKSVSIKYS